MVLWKRLGHTEFFYHPSEFLFNISKLTKLCKTIFFWLHRCLSTQANITILKLEFIKLWHIKMEHNLDLGIVQEIHLQYPLNARHPKKYLNKNNAISETNPKPRTQGCLSRLE